MESCKEGLKEFWISHDQLFQVLFEHNSIVSESISIENRSSIFLGQWLQVNFIYHTFFIFNLNHQTCALFVFSLARLYHLFIGLFKVRFICSIIFLFWRFNFHYLLRICKTGFYIYIGRNNGFIYKDTIVGHDLF